MPDDRAAGHGLTSLDAALGVLAFMARQSGALTLSDIARGCGMPPSKVHRYLASFVAAGLVKQQWRSGRYDLGPEALQFGLAALARHDFVNHTADGLPDLAQKTGMTVQLSVWANEVATIVRWERGFSPTVTSMGLGTTLPLLNSATGRIFLAWGPPAAVRSARDRELQQIRKNPNLQLDFVPDDAGLNILRSDIRARGFASVDSRFIPGLVAAAAPILDWQHEAQAAVTLVGVSPELVEPGSDAVRELISFCSERSVMLEDSRK